MSNGIAFCHTDNDGYCAAAVLHRALPDVYIFPINYGTKTPWNRIRPGEPVYLLDFSFPVDDMLELNRLNNPIGYFDHHWGATKELLDAGVQMTGLWTKGEDDLRSSALLTWEFWFNEKPPPRIVRWISDFDTWANKLPESIPFNYGLSLVDIRPFMRNEQLWVDLLNDEEAPIAQILAKGNELAKYYALKYAACRDDLMYETELFGHRALAMNIRGVTSLVFGHREDVELLMLYQWDGQQMAYRVSIFRAPGSKVDVGELATKFGGNGHPGAAGFLAKTLPFQQGGHEKELSFEDPYDDFNKFVDAHPNALQVETMFGFFGSTFTASLAGNSCIGVNSCDTTGRQCGRLQLISADVAISFVWTNSRKYRVIVRPLTDAIDLPALRKKYSGRIVGNDLWFYVDQLPFELEEYKRNR